MNLLNELRYLKSLKMCGKEEGMQVLLKFVKTVQRYLRTVKDLQKVQQVFFVIESLLIDISYSHVLCRLGCKISSYVMNYLPKPLHFSNYTFLINYNLPTTPPH